MEADNDLKSRRQFLRFSSLAAGGLIAAAPLKHALAAACGLTPAQTAGPFYPGESEFEELADLTVVRGRAGRARGEVVYVEGQVLDEECRPVTRANVEIWQACASGRYNNPKDPNPAPLDPNFRYWGETYTNAEGFYRFKTIVPGAYPADRDWTRPPHIHFRVAALGYEELVTQMYFKGNAWNARDLILQRIPPAERERVVVEFKPSAAVEPGAKVGVFNVTLRSVRGRSAMRRF